MYVKALNLDICNNNKAGRSLWETLEIYYLIALEKLFLSIPNIINNVFECIKCLCAMKM